MSGGKNIYLKKFNKLIAKGVYTFEKKKMRYDFQNKIDNLFKK